MRRFRVSIAAMVAGIAGLGVSLAALIHPSPLWGNAFFSAAFGSLVLAVPAACYGRGPRRAFRVGFATCGWAYFLATLGPDPLSRYQSHLVTTALLEIAYPYTIPSDDRMPDPSSWYSGWSLQANQAANGVGPFELSPATAWQSWTTANRFIVGGMPVPMMYSRVGHSIFCLLSGLIGGFATRRFREPGGPDRPSA